MPLKTKQTEQKWNTAKTVLTIPACMSQCISTFCITKQVYFLPIKISGNIFKKQKINQQSNWMHRVVAINKKTQSKYFHERRNVGNINMFIS